MATTPTGYGSNIRQSLVGKGVSNDDIGYNKATGYVTVKGQDFLKPSKVLDGVSYDTQSAFNNAWNNYQKKSTPTSTTTNTTSVPSGLVSTREGLGSYGIDSNRVGYNNGNVTVDNRSFGQPTLNAGGTSYYTPSGLQNDYSNFQRNNLTNQLYNYQLPDNPYTSQIADQINYLINQSRNHQPIDPYSTAEYAARQAQAQKSAQQATRGAQEALGSSGFGRSTMLADRAQGIQNDANEYLETQVLPQIIANEQARRQQEYNNIFNLLTPLYNQQAYSDNRSQTERANLMDTLGYINDRDQQAFNNSITEAGVTGNYMPPQAQEIVNQILQLKQAAESPNITREQRAQLSSQADQLRSRLDALGVNSSLVGSNVNYNTARGTQIGIPTLEAQGQTFNQNMDNREFDESVRQFDLTNAQNQAYQGAQISNMNADNSRQNATTEFNRLMDIWQATNSAPSGIPGVTPGTPYGGVQTAQSITAEEYATNYLDKAARYDEDGALQNTDAIENAILESGLPSSEMRKLYIRYGIELPSSGN